MAANRSVRIDVFGGPEVLTIDELPIPEPGSGEILVRIRAASVNPVDYKTRAGGFPAVTRDRLPRTLGRDLSGIVERAGAGAAFKPGDAVYAMPDHDRGTYADYVVLRPGEAAARPDSLDDLRAACVPLAALTAWQGLYEHGRLEGGQSVLIHGGAGGVGHFAVQFAHATGARVFTTAAGKDLDFVRSLGADEAIDYRQQQFEIATGDVDLVLDLIGGETQERSWSVLRRGGTLVSSLTEPSQERARELAAQGVHFMAHPDGAQLAEIARLIDAGRVRVELTESFPFEQVRAAHRRLEETHPRGKIALRLD